MMQIRLTNLAEYQTLQDRFETLSENAIIGFEKEKSKRVISSLVRMCETLDDNMHAGHIDYQDIQNIVFDSVSAYLKDSYQVLLERSEFTRLISKDVGSPFELYSIASDIIRQAKPKSSEIEIMADTYNALISSRNIYLNDSAKLYQIFWTLTLIDSVQYAYGSNLPMDFKTISSAMRNSARYVPEMKEQFASLTASRRDGENFAVAAYLANK
jgi:hypothetical protein